MQWKNEADSCQFHGLPSPTLNSTGCHDSVDFSLCFEDSAILYVISIVFLVVAGFSFCGNSQRPKLSVGLLHAFKLVSDDAQCTCTCSYTVSTVLIKMSDLNRAGVHLENLLGGRGDNNNVL